MGNLALTGERTVPNVPGEEYWFARHDVVYRWIADTMITRNSTRIIIDAGSGEGWGPASLAHAASPFVIGLEYDEAAVRHATDAYPDVQFIRANLADMPLGVSTAVLLVSLQVMEHLWSLPQFLRRCAEILRPGATAVFSTPNRPVFSPGLKRGQVPVNPFHVEEFDADQMMGLLVTAGFCDIEMGGVVHGRRLSEWEIQHGAITGALLNSATVDGHPPTSVTLALAHLLPTISAEDFTLNWARPHESAWQDLVAIARTPS